MNSNPVGGTGNGGGGGAEDHILIRDEKANTTVGGTFTAGAWQTRDLNTEVYDTGNHASIASNQITLAAGTYRVKARCPAFAVGRHKCKLRNITDGADIIIGSSEDSAAGIHSSTISVFWGRFTIGTAKVLELQHRCETSKVTLGLGISSNFGVIEVYSSIELTKEA